MSILTQVWLIFHCVSPTVLLLVGWVMAVLQAALAAQYLVNALVRLRVFPSFGS